MINNTYAIIKAGGKQIKAEVGQAIWIEKIDKEIDEIVSFKDIIALSNDGEISLGTPVIKKVEVIATVQKHGKGPKLVIFRTKAKSNWSRKQGHRQPYTRLLVEQISLNGKIIAKIEGTTKKSDEVKVVDSVEVKKPVEAKAKQVEVKKAPVKKAPVKKAPVKKESSKIDPKIMDASNAKVDEAHRALYVKATELNLGHLELSDIKGIGIKTLNYLKSQDIKTIGDLISVKAKGRDALILGLPGLKSEDLLIKNEKFLYFLKQAHELLESANLEKTTQTEDGIDLKELAILKSKILKAHRKLRTKTIELKLENLKLKDIKGVGNKTLDYLKFSDIETIGDLIKIRTKKRDALILGLPGLKSEDILIKSEKFINFLEQAQDVLNEKQKVELAKAKKESLKKLEASNAKVEVAHKALHETATKLNLGHLHLIDIKGVGVKTFVHFKDNNIKTINDLINIGSEKRAELISKLPGLKSENLEIKNEKFINFLKQAHEMLKEKKDKK